MKDIQFTKQGKTYVAEFEVNADFNLHIEKSQSGYLYMQQRSTSGKWDSVRNFQATDSDYIIDYDFTALVYPKQIRLVSEYAPTMCVLTSDGDVIEIKSQSKEVEITQNGEMSVTPDDGFAYLSSVNVKTNVPQQGGEESGGGSSSEWVYIRLADIESEATKLTLSIYQSLSRVYSGNTISIAPAASAVLWTPDDIISVALDKNLIVIPAGTGVPTTLNEMLLAQSINLDEFPQITKEEFYSTEV